MKNEDSSNIVFHKKYGIGKILQKRFGGFKVLVEFSDGIERWVRFNTVKFINTGEVHTKKSRKLEEEREENIAVGQTKEIEESPGITNVYTEEIEQVSRNNWNEDWFKSRSIIESLRLGIVPQGYIEEFTIGRDNEIKEFEKYLLDDKPIIVEGEYGAGKTHFIEYAYSYALNHNWAVATINIDSQETALNKPKSIYRSIVKSFAFKKKNGGFKNFLKEIAKSDKYIKLREHTFLMGAINIIRDEKTDDDFWEYIEGKTDTCYRDLPKLPEIATTANLYINIISGISWASKNILNKNGLILFFDEVESLDESFLYSYYRKERDKDFLKGLIGVVSNDERLLREYTKTDTLGAKTGEETGLRYYGHNIIIKGNKFGFIRFAWKLPSYLKTVLAFTPGSYTVSKILSDANKITLDYLDESELTEIADRLRYIYESAYHFHIDKLDSYDLIVGEEQTRLSIKRFVESMDIKRFNVTR